MTQKIDLSDLSAVARKIVWNQCELMGKTPEEYGEAIGIDRSRFRQWANGFLPDLDPWEVQRLDDEIAALITHGEDMDEAEYQRHPQGKMSTSRSVVAGK